VRVDRLLREERDDSDARLERAESAARPESWGDREASDDRDDREDREASDDSDDKDASDASSLWDICG